MESIIGNIRSALQYGHKGQAGKPLLGSIRVRLIFAILVIFAVCALVCAKVIYLALDHYLPAAPDNQPPASALSPRSDITDTNGNIIATDLPAVSLFVNPQKIQDPLSVARSLASVMPDLGMTKLMSLLKSDKKFVWIKRKMPPAEQYKVSMLGIPELQFVPTYTRVYPRSNLFSSSVGFVDVDENGMLGIEKSVNSILSSGSGPVQTTLNSDVQFILRDALQQAASSWHAEGAAGIVMDVNTGEIIALVSLDDFDPNKPESATFKDQYNKVTNAVYELGSVYKILNTAIALDSGRVKITDQFDVSKYLKISKFTIHDFEHINRKLTVPEIFTYSSNIGSGKMIMQVGIPTQKEYFKRFGLMDPLLTDFPDTAPPMLPKLWGKTESITISYGHGIAANPLQLISTVGSLVNGGHKIYPHILKNDVDYAHLQQDQIISPQTSATIRKLMRLNTLVGTGFKANISGFLIGSKSGTADLPSKGGYDKSRVIADFTTVFPAYQPKYVMFMMVYAPKPHYAGQRPTGAGVNATFAANALKKIAPILGVMPSSDQDTKEVINMADDVKKRAAESAR